MYVLLIFRAVKKSMSLSSENPKKSDAGDDFLFLFYFYFLYTR
jgi:hypothetical protein